MMPDIKAYFHERTCTITYLVTDPATHKAVLIDTVTDFDPASGKISYEFVDAILNELAQNKLKLEWVIDTHIHADHISAAGYVKNKTAARSAIGHAIKDVIRYWRPIYDMAFAPEKYFDYFVQDGEIIKIGSMSLSAMSTPGHTPACMSFMMDKVVFSGDSIFMPSLGTARVDFPGGDAETLFHSIMKIYALGDDVKIYPGHDYPKEGKAPLWGATVAEQKRDNVMINTNISKDAFIQKRKERDKTLGTPRLLLASLQANFRAGLFEPEDNGISYIKIPINQI